MSNFRKLSLRATRCVVERVERERRFSGEIQYDGISGPRSSLYGSEYDNNVQIVLSAAERYSNVERNEQVVIVSAEDYRELVRLADSDQWDQVLFERNASWLKYVGDLEAEIKQLKERKFAPCAPAQPTAKKVPF